jgi:arginase
MPTLLDLIGAPTDVGASVRGASMGPEALRVAGLAQRLRARGLWVQDMGNVTGPANPWQLAQGGYRHLPEVLAWCLGVHEATLASLAAGHVPVLLGGDHSLAMGSISAVARHCSAQGRKLRVIWLDAHADFNTATITPSGNLHGMPVAVLAGFGPEALVQLAGHVPAVAMDAFRQVGVRSVDPEEKRFVHAQQLDVHDMRTLDEIGMRAVMQRVLADVDADTPDTHLHLSFDVDFLDPDIAPGVGTPVPGGPTYREAQLCMEMIADTGRLASLDIMELNPALDVRNRTAELVVDLVESLFGKSTLIRAAP